MPPATNRNGLAIEPSVWFFAGQVGPSGPLQHVPIYSTPFKIGRLASLPLSIPIECISKEHAEVVERNGLLYVRDLNSTNGTYKNGERIVEEARIEEGDIVQFATAVFRVGREVHQTASVTAEGLAGDRALAMMQFERLINDEAVVPFYQPIVALDDARSVVGYEALGRSSLFGLQTPGEMFSTASQLDLETELSRVLRRRGLECAQPFAEDLVIFVNTHPSELAEDRLAESLDEIRQSHPSRMITLEIHEATIATRDSSRQLRRVLSDLDIRLAFDDFGAGQDRLLELSEVNPDYLKFDISMIRGIHRAPASRQRVVAALAQMANDIGCCPLAEGVEQEETHETLRQMGFKLGQGFLYGEPASVSKCIAQVEGNDETR